MRVTIFGAGSQGDVLPCVRLGKGLQRTGFDVLLAAPQNFAGMVQEEGLAYHALRGDVQAIMAGATGQNYMESGGANPLKSIQAMRKMLGPVAVQMAEDGLAACRQADALIALAVFAPLGATMAEICGIPLILIEPTPLLPSGDFPAPGWPIQRNMGRWHNEFSGSAMLTVIWQWYRPFVNEFRASHGLAPMRNSDFHRLLLTVPLLGAYSPSVIARPSDWPENVQLTGYWFDQEHPQWEPPADLSAFLEQGEPPVYIGFGSMAGRNPEHLTAVVLDALEENGLRGILASGWGAVKGSQLPAHVYALSGAPHDWLFPRMSVVVHHGGAGTTAEGLRAGKPTVVVPFIVDQLFWGKRIHALGAGPEPIWAKNVSSANLGEAMRQASHDAAMRERAETLGRVIRQEDGVGNAVACIQQFLEVEYDNK